MRIINQVKDFLEANGYLGQLPARRLRRLPAQTLDFKGLRLDALVEEALQRCGAEAESRRFGVVYRSASLLARSDDGLLRFEAETPAAKWPLVQNLVRAWLASAGGR